MVEVFVIGVGMRGEIIVEGSLKMFYVIVVFRLSKIFFLE